MARRARRSGVGARHRARSPDARCAARVLGPRARARGSRIRLGDRGADGRRRATGADHCRTWSPPRDALEPWSGGHWIAGAAAAVVAVVVVVALPGQHTVKPNVDRGGDPARCQHSELGRSDQRPRAGRRRPGAAPMIGAAADAALAAAAARPGRRWSRSRGRSPRSSRKRPSRARAVAAQLVEQMRDAPAHLRLRRRRRARVARRQKTKRATVTVRGDERHHRGGVGQPAASSTTARPPTCSGSRVDERGCQPRLRRTCRPPTTRGRSTARAGAEIAGRPTTTVVASRSATGVGAEARDRHRRPGSCSRGRCWLEGRLERSLRFRRAHVGAGPSTASSGRSSATATSAVPDGYRGAACAAAAATCSWRRSAGTTASQLSYSDGLFTVSDPRAARCARLGRASRGWHELRDRRPPGAALHGARRRRHRVGARRCRVHVRHRRADRR